VILYLVPGIVARRAPGGAGVVDYVDGQLNTLTFLGQSNTGKQQDHPYEQSLPSHFFLLQTTFEL
jgi:hypothetical protein